MSTKGTTTHLLEKASVPGVLLNVKMSDLAETSSSQSSTLTKSAHFPQSSFAEKRVLKNGVRLPQAIAHRGYKAAFPENTIASFKGAVEVGAHALETDIHLTKDDVVVLSHDANLKRCFGRPEKIIDCTWESISQFQTIAEPKQSMPRLSDFLEYVASPGLDEIWVLLDIKLDNDPRKVMQLIASTIDAVPASTVRPWRDRIVLGIWATKYLPLCEEFLPGFAVSFIGFSTMYARRFFSIPNIAFNMIHHVLHGPIGSAFLRKARSLNRPIFAWTVNDENRMRWCIRKDLDGVISDDPKKFLEICKDYEELPVEKSVKAKEQYRASDYYQIVKFQLIAALFMLLFVYRHGRSIDSKYVGGAHSAKN